MIVMDEPAYGTLYLRLALFEDEGVFDCIACADLKSFTGDTADFIRQFAAEASGIPRDNILLSAPPYQRSKLLINCPFRISVGPAVPRAFR